MVVTDEYVRMCPRCGVANNEIRTLCENCKYYIGSQKSILATKQKEAAEEITTRRHSDVGAQESDEKSRTSFLFLEVSGERYSVCDGATVGRADSNSSAEVQLSNLPDIGFVHRRHCRFELHGSRWYCTALDEGSFNPPNPTFVNGELVEAGQSRRIDHGDTLSLGNVRFTISLQ